ncbi:DUF2627 domain-containing protein [Cohnella sp. REN36]|uniref:DUF2627 domain-containing protein n=1 Tax=Cohnella sp. REN36 TaxID=2887347 RepID=UPI001D15038E|nr:DUF2627 domain-containing protein [Cohnella sp. REN36]MCC3373418.1 DUF2627 domain-containing protein [Cohnella sp. REN36]
MKLVVSRLIAVLLLVIPGVMAAYGFLLMKDALWDYFAQLGNVKLPNPEFAWLHFVLGFVLFLIGVGFIGGWIFFRDRKHNYVSPRFRAKRPPRPPRAQESGKPTE